jgi:hypothetical protein
MLNKFKFVNYLKKKFFYLFFFFFSTGESDVELVDINNSPINTEENYKYLTSIMMNNNKTKE